MKIDGGKAWENESREKKRKWHIFSEPPERASCRSWASEAKGFISSFRDKSAARHKVISHNGSSENWTVTPVADCMGKYLAREKKGREEAKVGETILGEGDKIGVSCSCIPT